MIFIIKKPKIKYRMSGETVPLMSDGEPDCLLCAGSSGAHYESGRLRAREQRQ
jgi:hypothetical protein